MILYSFQRPFIFILSLDSQYKCLLSRLGKICEPHFTDWSIFFPDCSPIFRPRGLLGLVEATELEFDLRIFCLHLVQDGSIGLHVPE